MKAKYNKSSWEKQTVFDLENGWQAIVEYNLSYGEYVKRLNSPGDSNTFWLASNGLDEVPKSCAGFNYIALPDFARDWIEDLKNKHGVFARLVRPKFKELS